MRVLHVFGRMGRGGAERRTVELLGELDAGTHPQHFLTLTGLPGCLDGALQANGGHLHPCRLGPRFPMRYANVLRRVRPDVVHSHVHWPSGPLLAQAAAAGVPGRIVHFRSSPPHPSGARAARDAVFRELVRRYATGVHAVSAGALEHNWGASWRNDPRCSVLYSGFDATRFGAEPDPSGVRDELGIPRDARILIHVGNVRHEKNHARLGLLFAALAPRHPDLWLLTVGHTKEPALERALADQLRQDGVADRWVHAGEREDVPRLLQASDLFVFPSVREGLPGACVEARMAGLGVVASDLPGICEIADHLERVTPLSLDLPDADWLDAMESALDSGHEPWVAGRTPIDHTPFAAASSAAAHVAAWEASLNQDPS